VVRKKPNRIQTVSIHKITLGDLNREIDEAFHKQAEKNPFLWIVDGIAHTIVEQLYQKGLEYSAQKFVQYNLKPLVNSGVEYAIKEINQWLRRPPIRQ